VVLSYRAQDRTEICRGIMLERVRDAGAYVDDAAAVEAMESGEMRPLLERFAAGGVIVFARTVLPDAKGKLENVVTWTAHRPH
jgi:hypothetical protein